MVIGFGSHSVTLFALLSVLCSQGSGFPALGSYSSLRQTHLIHNHPEANGNVIAGAQMNRDSEKLYYQLSANLPSRTTRHADGLFTSGYSKLLGQLSARRYLESLIGKRVSGQDEEIPTKRHSDAIFTDNYSRIRKQMAVKKYIDNLLTGKRSQEELISDHVSDSAPLGETYNSAMVDDLLNHLPPLNI
ncbi:VIP peptides-like [Narcine bancroftii]|uniref:VIP peptides-like n=1 Tax=Narcine bancroftii TaxID=1343680 RepID=UPI003831208D